MKEKIAAVLGHLIRGKIPAHVQHLQEALDDGDSKPGRPLNRKERRAITTLARSNNNPGKRRR